jgi:hypothetical protein
MDACGGDPIDRPDVLLGHLESETVLDETNSPYLLVSSVIVDEGVLLTLEPGTVVRATTSNNRPTTLRINGELRVNGTFSGPVVLTSNDPNPSPGDWEGVQISGGDGRYSQIAGARIRYARTGIRSSDAIGTWRTVVQDTRVEHCTEHGIQSVDGDITVQDSILQDIDSAGVFLKNADVNISGSTIQRANFGVDVQHDTWITGIVGPSNIIENMGTGGIRAFVDAATDFRIESNTIRQPSGSRYQTGTGIYIRNLNRSSRPQCTISGNTIEAWNTGIYARGRDTSNYLTPFPELVIEQNCVTESASYALYTREGTEGCDHVVGATDNWWGAADAATIEDLIYDCTDDSQSPTVDYDPFQQEPSCGSQDSDGDGLPDYWESNYGLDPFSADTDGDGTRDENEDEDEDGLTSLEEYDEGTDPDAWDTDGGGESDGSEVDAGRDPRNPNDDDGDGDTFGSALDCDSDNADVHSEPSPVEGLNVELLPESNVTRISWQSQDPQTGTGTSYDVVSGNLSELLTTQTFDTAMCLAGEHPDTPYDDVRSGPAPRAGYYYLVRARNTCEIASFGDSTLVPDPRDDLDVHSPCP